MIYLYKRNKTGICIDRVYGYDTIVELPDMLEGFPVTELGAYIFSDHIDSTELKMMQEKENFCTENGKATRPEDDMPQAAGNRVEETVFHVSSGRLAGMLFITVFILRSLRSMEKCRTWVQEHLPAATGWNRLRWRPMKRENPVYGIS